MDSLKPTKEQIRQYMAQRQVAHCPPPTMTEIRRQLGWGLMNTRPGNGSK